MYPEDDPPPRSFLTYVTIHPARDHHSGCQLERRESGCGVHTSDGHFDADIHEDEHGEQVQCAQPEDLSVLAILVVRRRVFGRGFLSDLRQTFFQRSKAEKGEVSMSFWTRVGRADVPSWVLNRKTVMRITVSTIAIPSEVR